MLVSVRLLARSLGVGALGLLVNLSCGGNSDASSGSSTGGNGGRPPEQTGALCEADSECFPDVAEGALEGEPVCQTRVRGGYCTHTCETDANCCAVEGECKTDLPQVCSPFESSDGMMCFLSCEPDEVAKDPDAENEQHFCQRNASADFICRSSGGGAQNRKICVPGDCGVGADCTSDADCNGLTCVTSFRGGYCTERACSLDADCPGDARCVTAQDGNNYCFSSCASAADCSFCRHDGSFATCSDEVVFAEPGASGSVCTPPT